MQAQDSVVLKSADPNYAQYSPDLTTGFDIEIAPVTVTVAANGKPVAFNSVPLPMAVVMALKDYEFRPLDSVQHGKAGIDGATYEVKLNLPIRQSKTPGLSSDPIALQNPVRAEVVVIRDGKPAVKVVQAMRVGRSLSIGLLLHHVRPAYPEAAKAAHIQGTVTLEAMIGKQGDVESLKASNGPIQLVEAAYEAVSQWKYRPYLQNREPVDMVTDIEIVFQ